MMNVGRTMAMFNAWVRQAEARSRREIRWAEDQERRALIAEAAKEGKTPEQKMAEDLQNRRKHLQEEIAELTMTTKEADLNYAKDKQSLRRRVEELRVQIDETKAQINENSGFVQTLFYGRSRKKNGQEEEK